MLLQIKIYLSDLGITWHSCSGMYPEAIAQVIPKSVCEASVFAKQKQVSKANPLPKAIANKSFQRKDWVSPTGVWCKFCERLGQREEWLQDLVG